MSSPKHIALIGCGFTGTSAFYQLIDKYPVEKVTIFEATGEFGPGFAYQTDESRDYLINNTTDTMCLIPSNPRAFLEWLRGRRDLVPNLEENGHLPRAIYGEFLKDVFSSTRTSAAVKGIEVELIPHEASDISENEDGVVVSWDNGETLVDTVIMTTGRCIETQPFPFPPEQGALYIESHIKSDEFDRIALDDTVHIMGASLSAYDVINRLFSPDTGCKFERDNHGELTYTAGPNQRHAVLCSRSGRLKGMQTKYSKKLERKAFIPERIRYLSKEGKVNLSALRDLLLLDAARNTARLDVAALLEPFKGCADATELNNRAVELLTNSINLAENPAEVNFLVQFFDDAEIDIWDLFAEHLLPAKEELKYRNKIETAVLSYAAGFSHCQTMSWAN